jgi:hypothetical protein
MSSQIVAKPALHFIQGKDVLSDFTPEFQKGLYLENVLKPTVCCHIVQITLKVVRDFNFSDTIRTQW